jgi:hypothetical protein
VNTVSITHEVFGIDMEVVPTAELRRELAPRILPPHWREVAQQHSEDGLAWTYEPPFGRRFKVLMSACRETDGNLWLHVSLSKWRGNEMEEPSWSDIRNVKDLFVGRERKAIVVLPPQSQYVNISEVHHLWCCLDTDTLPDFSKGSGSI